MLQRLALARASVDRAGVRWTDDAWLAVRWAHPASLAVRVHAGRTPVRDGRLVLVPTTDAGPGTTYFLGVDQEDVAYFGVATKDPITEVDGVELLDLRAVGGLLDDRDAGLLVHAIGAGQLARGPRLLLQLRLRHRRRRRRATSAAVRAAGPSTTRGPTRPSSCWSPTRTTGALLGPQPGVAAWPVQHARRLRRAGRVSRDGGRPGDRARRPGSCSRTCATSVASRGRSPGR